MDVYDARQTDTKAQTVVPILYNVGNVVTSDVIVRFDGGRREFLSEKRTLSAVSGYFKHAFSGNFSVSVCTSNMTFALSPSPRPYHPALCLNYQCDQHN